MNFRNRSVDVHQFSMIPRADIPRSSFRIQTSHKTTFDSGYLVPIYLDEILPGDSFACSMTAFVRLATPIVPVMDNLTLESFFFFVPNRLIWTNWNKFCGEQTNPGDSTSFTIPVASCPAGGYLANTVQDYFGIPGAGQITAGTGQFNHNNLPMRAYNLIWNEWFRDENLQNSVTVDTGNGPDIYSSYVLLRRGKRHDYFTSALPFLQKGTAVPLPLGTSAPVKTQSTSSWAPSGATPLQMQTINGVNTGNNLIFGVGTAPNVNIGTNALTAAGSGVVPTNLYADLSGAAAATINQLRQSFQIQKLLERDARGGTRYTEIVRSHFGVISPDARLNRPEYLGGGSSPINVQEIPQTGGTGASGTTTALGTLGATGRAVAHGHGFRYSATEHGYIIGLLSVRADLAYQQGLRKLWSRSTRYDFYWPAFAMLGEQSVYNREIYQIGDDAGANTDGQVFGYQERWAEYRYNPSLITGLFRSTATGTLDTWHLAQKFTARPTLNTTFIQDTPPVSRIVAVTPVLGKEFLCDAFFSIKAARPLPMYSVPGLIDHF